MSLAAYFDDSMANSGDERLIVAGYLNLGEKWDLFGKAWNECLNEPPSISYFRAVEANSRRGEFAEFTYNQRDAKVRRLSFIIRHFDPISFEFSMSTAENRKQLKDVAPHGLKNPHFICTFGAISMVARAISKTNTSGKIQFMFDEQQGVDKDMDLFFDHMIKNLPRGAQKLIQSPVHYGSDRDHPALQAADMLAWHLRRQYERVDVDEELIDRLRRSGRHYVSEISDEIIPQWREQYAKIEHVDLIHSKQDWKKARRLIRETSAQGYLSPYGTRIRNLGSIRNSVYEAQPMRV
jgi:hypothetical protein